MSLKNMKRLRIVHSTFPFETVEQYIGNKINKSYSTAYEIASLSYYTLSKKDIKTPFKERGKLGDKIMDKESSKVLSFERG